MWKKLLLINIALILLTGCQPVPISTSPGNPADVGFEISEGNSLIDGEISNLSGEVPGNPVALYGHLVDTGELNMFYIYSFDGVKVSSKRYFFSQRIYEGSEQGIWASVSGTYSESEYIDADKFERIDEIDKQVERAGKQACEWVAKNRTSYDLNPYKNTDRFKALGFSALMDLNEAEFRPANLTVFIDFKKMTAGFDCGSSVLGENSQRGDFLTYMVIYDLDEMKLIKAIIRNTGYFLE